MHYLALIHIAIIFGITCFLTYSETANKQWWYMPVGIAMGALINITWYSIVRIVPEKEDLFFFSIVYLMVFNGLAILFFNLKLDKMSIFGAILIFIGILIMKIKS